MPATARQSASVLQTLATPVDVAVAVLIRSDGAALLAQRPRDKVYSGYWEFSGGKIEPGEPVAEALRREIGRASCRERV